MTDKKYCLILAAGDGKRMKSDKPKALAEVLFRPMIDWVLNSAERAGMDDIAVVVGSKKELLKAHLAKRGEYKTYTQTERRGTAHAVMMAKEFIKAAADDNADLFIAYADAPFTSSAVMLDSLAVHKSEDNDITVISANVPNPFGYGRIVRENGAFSAIVEEKDCTAQQRAITEINSGLYWFKPAKLLKCLDRISNDNANGEYYLTDAAALLAKRGVYVSEDDSVVLGANSRAQLADLNRMARDRVLERLLDEGAEIPLDDGIIITDEVVVGKDTVILPNTIIKGKTTIGAGCTIGPNSYIEDCVIGDNVKLNNVQAFKSSVDDDATVGPFVHLRAGTHLHNGVKIGDFVEVKNSEIGTKTSIAHLTYVGDSDVGKDVNFGCGCVTANYDGIDKFRTVIGDHAFIGCNTNLIAPVTVGENATTAAGSTITKDVPPDSLAVERGTTRIKENWEKNHRRIKKA
ncbi:MAG: bifunctional UDP-N-acetylglucosamine diphosphorylase/glucosamine-1-phosphate N-acetyltransferase GlmU [Eubacterium sp.]|nr:bifunctional UDP-N-acetylglucosamine diphosphorylase/glucosamine-1-phosphate N-acetyltransferase GlmU [Eubacterium sp.]